MKKNIVPITELKNECNYKNFSFKTTKTLSSEITPIGQERAIEAIEVALNIRKKGFNLFLSGESGCGKSSVIKAVLHKRAKTEPVPFDWIYVYNFENDSLPVPIQLPNGKARLFAKDIDNFVNDFILQIPKVYESKHLKGERNQLLREYTQKENELEDELTEKIESCGFRITKTDDGNVIANPINEAGELLSPEDVAKFDVQQRKNLDERQHKIQEHIDENYRDNLKIEKALNKKLEKHFKKVVEEAIEDDFNQLYEKYKLLNKELKQHLKAIKEDILLNAQYFLALLIQEEILQPYKKYTAIEEITNHYKVNLFVNNSKLEGAPVIFDNNPTITSLFGMIEYTEDPNAGQIASFINIKPGKIHLANGGYLVLEAIDLYKNYRLWELLKRVIRNEEIQIGEDAYVHSTRIAVRIEPQAIPVKFKVIIVGTPELHDFFTEYDESFDRLFKIKADFNSEIPRTEENEHKYASFIGSKCTEDNLLHLDKSGVGSIIDHSSAMADDKYMLSTNFSKIVDILVEADYIARANKKNNITGKDIHDAISKMEYRLKKDSESFQRWIKENIIYIHTNSDVIGQINGLTVLNSAEYEFGLPVRLTAKTFVGDIGVLNIEREVRMSGQIHDKGVMILSGYLGSIFGQDKPLSFEAYITFEQQYYHIDGDSASSTELYAILSSLADVSINQRIAVTGSVNQNGEIQPIGGVNEKIKGFFEICKYRGLNKNGVMIPKSNVRNLMLSDEIIEAVKNGDFTIYAIETIEEGLEILTGIKAGNVTEKDTIFYKANEKLNKFYKILSDNTEELDTKAEKKTKKSKPEKSETNTEK